MAFFDKLRKLTRNSKEIAIMRKSETTSYVIVAYLHKKGTFYVTGVDDDTVYSSNGIRDAVELNPDDFNKAVGVLLACNTPYLYEVTRTKYPPDIIVRGMACLFYVMGKAILEICGKGV